MSNVLPTLKYAWITVKHKWFVFLAGIRTRAPLWNLIVHDLSKFGPAELPHYGRQFCGDQSDPLGFARAWLHHQSVNNHHPEYWIPRSGHKRGGYPDGQPLPMSEPLVREMVADWLGASRAYSGRWPRSREDWGWLNKSYPRHLLHDETHRLVQQVLDEVFG